jgi:hypothetical protein
MSVCRTCGYKTKIFIENIIEWLSDYLISF